MSIAYDRGRIVDDLDRTRETLPDARAAIRPIVAPYVLQAA
jgi:hypothetical protein